MLTNNQLLRNNCRLPKKIKNKTPALQGNPQLKGVCVKVFTKTPKKPNSAIRKVSKIKKKLRINYLTLLKSQQKYRF